MRRLILLLALIWMIPGISWAGEDHTENLEGPFQNPEDVTKACLECHEDAASEVMKTSHWKWSLEQNFNGQKVEHGKKVAINNFCISVQSNWPRCTSCHVGYGWKDGSFDFTQEAKVDCLVCHDTTGTYKKAPPGAGMPKKDVNLLKVAQSVGKAKPSRQNCGTCHFYGGGGDGVKHGDLDSSLLNPSRDLDVHMSPKGLDFSCVQCHKTTHHQIAGHAFVDSPKATDHLTCESCHGNSPHHEGVLNDHATVVACQTCHIPAFAREKPTKMAWDWSKAGLDKAPAEAKEQYGKHGYHKKKGLFKWGKNVVPTYAWYDGTSNVYRLGDKVNPKEVVKISYPNGKRGDGKSKIYPFKVHRGKQIYDTQNLYLIVPHLFGKDGYWKTFDWNQSAQLGMAVVGLDYSGKYGFIETESYWRINHMVAPKEKALKCQDCHGEQGRLDWKALGYDKNPMVIH